jgi:hypothetical protein
VFKILFSEVFLQQLSYRRKLQYTFKANRMSKQSTTDLQLTPPTRWNYINFIIFTLHQTGVVMLASRAYHTSERQQSKTYLEITCCNLHKNCHKYVGSVFLENPTQEGHKNIETKIHLRRLTEVRHKRVMLVCKPVYGCMKNIISNSDKEPKHKCIQFHQLLTIVRWHFPYLWFGDFSYFLQQTSLFLYDIFLFCCVHHHHNTSQSISTFIRPISY